MLSEKLRTIRIGKKMTKKQMSELLEMAYTTYNNYEVGAREPNSDTLIKMATTLNVSTDYLLTDNAGRYEVDDPGKQQLINNYDKLNLIGKQKLIAYSDDLVGNPTNTEPFELVHTASTK